MEIKIDSKTLIKFGSIFAGGIAVGAVGGIKLYKENKKFQEWMDNKVFPGMETFIQENSGLIYKKIVVTVFDKNPIVRDLFLSFGDSIESGDKRLTKKTRKGFFKIKDKLPEMIDLIEKKAKEIE